jgi:hypothetical protein
MRLVFPLALAFSLCVNAADASAGETSSDGLCDAAETTYFACKTRGDRWISLCGKKAGVQYRFGRRGAVEFQYPASAPEGLQKLFLSHHSRFQTERLEVRFENAGTEYVLFDYLEGQTRTAGLRVVTADQKEHELRCAAPVTRRLLELKRVLQCDAESALNDARCGQGRSPRIDPDG